MATSRFEIKYEDGTEATVKVKPRHLIAYEDAMGGDIENAKTAADSFKLAWIAADSAETFEDWINTVDEINNPDATDTPANVPAAEIAVDGGPAEVVPTE
jgi:uncharacterized protein YndB with AHSA1/START domain